MAQKDVLVNLLLKDVEYSKTTKKLLLCLDLTTTRLTANPSRDVRGVIITLQGTVSNGSLDESGTVYEFFSRYFSPWVGIPEDPVTESWLC
ncbi:phenazine biosynthesis-like domain-containing protein [Montipora capricornis]|uniref:phenazine biosynthesis-like domain-containing protein n=1 Tax=Montipora foliosa TaxID=591990 RepID=UPI0035F13E99